MKKKDNDNYLAPMVKVVAFRIERGFAFTGGNESFETIQANDANTTLTGSSNFSDPASGGEDNTNTFGNIF
ncbi:MAG: hypothetical protein J5641_05105 [Bacteroidales bacterium]|nr:hypothetical protein [Bacteroidales bacterium]